GNFFSGEMTTAVDRRVRLGDEIILFAIAGEILNVVGHTAVMHLAIRRFDKPEFIDPGECRHRTDQTDVWTLRRFNWTYAPIVRRMNVANFEAGAIAAQTTRSERRQTTFMGQFGQRIRLV